MLLESLPVDKLEQLNPIALERMVCISGRWYYENVLTKKRRRFPKCDDWEDESNSNSSNQVRCRKITYLTIVASTVSCDCGKLMRFKRHYLGLDKPENSSRKADRVYVYGCPCGRELQLDFPQVEELFSGNGNG